MNQDIFVADVPKAGDDKRAAREKRAEARIPLRFKVAIVYHLHEDAATRPTFHGRTHDISTHGLSVVVDSNIFSEGEVTVLLAIPPAHIGTTQKIIEATARMVYTVFSPDHDAFRVGLDFRKFKSNGKELLKAVIDQRLMKPGSL